VQVDEHPDQTVDARADHIGATERVQFGTATNHIARDVFDHLERRTQHRVVIAHRHGTRHRHRAVGQRSNHPVFPAHIVGRRGETVQRRSSQHPLGGVVEDQEGQV
jgi:hypothetical protein